MKKLSYLLGLLLAATVLFIACDRDDPPPRVVGVTLNNDTLKIDVGDRQRLTTSFQPANAAIRTMTWTSSDTLVAVVNTIGWVTALSVGEAIITVTTADRQRTATARIIALPVAVEGVGFNRDNVTMGVGELETLTIVTEPVNATNRDVSWSSDNPTVASVDNGVITAHTPGTAVITTVTEEGGYSASITVMVTPPLTTDDGVLIDNIRWATRNVSAPGTFVAARENRGMFYQWNRQIGWTTADPLASSDGTTAWNRTTPSGTMWIATNNPCPTGWRLPTRAELESLRNSRNVWHTENGVTGRLFGTSPNQIFLPAAGWRSNDYGALTNADLYGSYWCSEQHTNNEFAWNLFFNSRSITVGGSWRASGRSIRCVAE